MISKELLSEVLGKEVTNVEITMYGHFDISLKNDYGTEINKYELSHKCKEWALTKGIYSIASGLNFERKQLNDISYWASIQTKQGCLCDYHYSNTEPEAIFKVCQWILENKVKAQ
jgi:hypothetical protein